MKARKLIPLVLIAAGLLAYHNSFTGPFIFDDVPSIQDNPTIRHLWPIWGPLSTPHRGRLTVEGRPIVNLSLAINYALGGYEVWGYHALNLTVHLLAGLTLLGIVRRTLRSPRLRERFGASADGLALATAVLWTVHPLQTESVTYVIQRAEVIMGLSYLLTLYCFIRAVNSRRTGVWYGLCLSTCALGMVSKEVMISAPVMVLLYDRAFVSASFRETWRRRWPLYLGLSATWVLLSYSQARSLGHSWINTQSKGVTWWMYLLTEPGVILHYLRLSLWPQPLCFDYYGWPIARTWTSALPAALVMVILLGATGWAWKTKTTWGFLGAWFFLILAPSSSFIPLDSPAFEHRMYLPLVAVVTLLVIGLYSLAGRRSAVVFVAAAIGFVFLSARRNQDYRSELAIWRDTVAKRPDNPRAQSSVGIALGRMGRFQEAIGHFEQALRLKPDYADAHSNLGTALLQEGDLQGAIKHYEQALQIEPNDAQAHFNFGVALEQAGQRDQAIDQ
ncbi:MAG TPA: tetratricopeptide repeat protein, partial [Verrucomicrobiae bacterium]|nr:tetratricopeptide repeat protein [Verrucomicrobiae bacterium]